MNYAMNKINNKILSQQAGWFGGKIVEFYSWGPRIKLHKLHLLWSTLEYKLNTSNLLKIILSRLGGLLIQIN
jgi:hypothetical protein